MIRTRYAPSPTGYMQIGNLRTALYEFLIARSNRGTFILRIEDTDQKRYVDGAMEAIYNTLALAGIAYDEGPDVGGDCGPYMQSERKGVYRHWAEKLAETGHGYYCFCTEERLEELHRDNPYAKYDRHCLSLTPEEVRARLDSGAAHVIRQRIPEGESVYVDRVYGEITMQNA